MVFDDDKVSEYWEKLNTGERKLNILRAKLSDVRENLARIKTIKESEVPINRATYKEYTDGERTKVLTAAIVEADLVLTEINKLT